MNFKLTATAICVASVFTSFTAHAGNGEIFIQNQTNTVDVTANDLDADGNGVKVTIYSNWTSGNLTLNVNDLAVKDYIILGTNFTDKAYTGTIKFSGSSTLGSADHQGKLTLDYGQEQNTYKVNLKDQSKVYADIRNNENFDFHVNYPDIYPSTGVENKTEITLSDSAEWHGNLINVHGVTGAEVASDKVNNLNSIKLTDTSAWTGAVIAEGGTADVTLENSAKWTVTQTSDITSVNSAGGTTLTLEDNVGFNFMKTDATKQSTISNLTTGANGGITLNGNVDVTIPTLDGDLNATFKDLESSKLKIATLESDTNAVTLIVHGQLNNGDSAALVDGLKVAYDGVKANYTIEQGLITDGSTGTIEGDNVTSTGTIRNTNLVTMADTTAISMMLWRAEADDLNQRMGDLRDSTANNGLWVRTHGGKMEATSVDNEFVGFQFGYDHNVSEGAQKQFVGGAISYTSGDATFANGSGDNYALGVTGYSTWLFENGSYLDVSAKYGTLNNKFDINAGDLGKLSGDYSTHGLAFNVETGHRFPVANLFYVEPQLAFTASHIFGEDYGAGQGVSVSQDSFDSYVARAGIAAGIKCPDNMGSVWMKASYLYDFDGETSTTAKNGTVSNKFDQDFGGSWYELGIGATVNFTKNLHGYADFEYAAGAEIETPYKWNVGARYVW